MTLPLGLHLESSSSRMCGLYLRRVCRKSGRQRFQPRIAAHNALVTRSEGEAQLSANRAFTLHLPRIELESLFAFLQTLTKQVKRLWRHPGARLAPKTQAQVFVPRTLI